MSAAAGSPPTDLMDTVEALTHQPNLLLVCHPSPLFPNQG
jgi:hypothetical protein